MLATDLFDHNDLQAILNLEDRAALMHERPASWPGILSKLRRVHNNDDLRSIVRELHSNTSETLAALTIQMVNLQDCIKAREPTAQLLTRVVNLADQAFQQTHLSYLFSSPLLQEEEELSCAAHRYAAAFGKLRNVQITLSRMSTVREKPTIQRTAFGLFRDSLSLLDGYADCPTESVRPELNTDVVAVQIREYVGGIPSELLEEFDFRPNGNGSGTGVRGMGDQVRGYFEPLEVACGNTVLVLTDMTGDKH
jgi:hypothetical protein